MCDWTKTGPDSLAGLLGAFLADSLLSHPDTIPMAQAGEDPFTAALAGMFYLFAGLAVLSLPLEMLRQMWLEWKSRRALAAAEKHTGEASPMPHESGAAPAENWYEVVAPQAVIHEQPPKPPGWGSLGEPMA